MNGWGAERWTSPQVRWSFPLWSLNISVKPGDTWLIKLLRDEPPRSETLIVVTSMAKDLVVAWSGHNLLNNQCGPADLLRMSLLHRSLWRVILISTRMLHSPVYNEDDDVRGQWVLDSFLGNVRR
jgi:hypothetical protein